MSKRIAAAIGMAVVCVFGVSQAQQPDELAALRGEVVRLNRSLELIHDRLDDLVTLQRTQLLIQRIGIEEQRVAPFSRELRDARSEKRHQEEEMTRLESYRDEVRDGLAELVRSGTDQEGSGYRDELAHTERMLEMQTDQMRTTDSRIAQLESDLDRARRSIEILEEKLIEAFEAGDK